MIAMNEARKIEEFKRLAGEAVAHHNAGRGHEAEAAYRAALQIIPGHPAVSHNLGVLAATRCDHIGAIERFDAAIEAEEHYASAHYYRAVSLEALGRRKEAIKAFARTVAVEPSHY